MKLTEDFKTELQKAVEVLKNGGIILYPTDTVWGIGCDATNADAVEKVYQLKQRSEAKSMIVLVDTDARLERHVQEVPEMAWDIIDISDKPTTIIYDQAKDLASNVVAEDGSIAIRVVKDKFCQQLVRGLGKPIISTSANISGSNSPKSFKDIDAAVLNGVDYVVNLRQNEQNNSQPSTIIKLSNSGVVQIIRK